MGQQNEGTPQPQRMRLLKNYSVRASTILGLVPTFYTFDIILSFLLFATCTTATRNYKDYNMMPYTLCLS